jgi:transposase
MSGGLLSPEDRAYFLRMMRRQLNSAVHRRMNVLLLLDDGWSVPRICEALFLDEGTVRGHRALYGAGGREGVERLSYRGGESALTQDQRDALAAWVDTTVPQTAREVCAHVLAQFGVRYRVNALSKLLKRLGFVHKKPKNVPAKADETVQRAFVEETLEPLMDAAGEAAPLYFVDATHPSYTGRPAHGWIRRGRTIELKSNHGRSRLDINGALSWPDRQIVYREEEPITSAAMIRLFEDLGRRHPHAARISVVLDNARYNISHEIRNYVAGEGCRIRLVYLPSYAPNLNLIERFWLFMKRKVLFNKAYAKFALFKEAFAQFFAKIDEYAAELKSLINGSFHYIGAAENGISVA